MIAQEFTNYVPVVCPNGPLCVQNRSWRFCVFTRTLTPQGGTEVWPSENFEPLSGNHSNDDREKCMVRTLVSKLLIPIVILGMLTACSSKTMVESDLGIKGAPDWVNEGTQVLKDKDGRLFHGVGFASPMGDESLQLASADNRARAEVARVLSSYMDVVFTDYTASASGGDEMLTEQDVSRHIENATKVNLTGARIIAHWRHPKNNVVYSLAELDMKHVKSTLQQVSNMNDQVRQYIHHHADNVFDRVVKENR